MHAVTQELHGLIMQHAAQIPKLQACKGTHGHTAPSGSEAEDPSSPPVSHKVMFVHDEFQVAQRLEATLHLGQVLSPMHNRAPHAGPASQLATFVLEAGDPQWFSECDDADVVVLLITPQFLRSSWCEGQTTFAKGAASIFVCRA